MFIQPECGEKIDALATKYIAARTDGNKTEIVKLREQIIMLIAPNINSYNTQTQEIHIDVWTENAEFKKKYKNDKLLEDYQNNYLVNVIQLLDKWTGEGSFVRYLTSSQKGFSNKFTHNYYGQKFTKVKNENDDSDKPKYKADVNFIPLEDIEKKADENRFEEDMGTLMYVYLDFASKFVQLINKRMSETPKFNYAPLFYTESLSLLRYSLDKELVDFEQIGTHVWRTMNIDFLNTYICEAMTESPEWDRLFECEFKKYSEFTGDKKDENEICVSVSAAKTSKSGSRAYSDNGSTLKPKVLLNYSAAAAAAAGKKQYIKNKDDVSTRRSDYYNKILSFLRDKRKEAELN